MKKNNRDFKGVWIPKEIWESLDLSLQEKAFLTEIDSLDNSERGCYASNKHFSDFFQLSKGRASQIINSLIEKNYLTVDYEYRGKEVKRRILKIKQGVFRKLNGGIKEIKQTYLRNDKDNNTISNNTLFNNTEDIIILNLLSHWIACKMISHKTETVLSEIKKKHKELIETYGEEIIKKAISNYSEIVLSDKYWFNYQWTFWDFLNRGLHKFIDEAKPLENYLKEEYRKIKNKSYEEEYMKKNADIIDNL